MTAADTPPRPRIRRKPSRRDEIADAGSRLFYERGYVNATLGDVTDTLGISAPAIYRHFASKQDLLRAVIERSLDAVEEAISHTEGAGVHATVEALARLGVEMPHMWEVLERDGRHLAPEARATIGRRVSAVGHALRLRILAERPMLTDEQTALVARAVMAVFTTPSAYPTRSHGDDLAATLTRAAMAVAMADTASLSTERLLDIPPSGVIASPTKREQVLQEAARLFSASGFETVSMSDIGEAVGMSGPSLYHYFPSKGDILVSILRRGLEWLAIDRGAHPDGTDPVRAFLESYARLAVSWREIFVLFVHEQVTLRRLDEGSIIGLYRDYFASGVALVRARRPELTARDARTLLACAFSVINDLAITRDEPGQDRDIVAAATILTSLADELLRT